jgi:lipopolysaccharide transport system permease protein
MWLFCTPIVYPSSLVPPRFRPLLSLNPCWGIIDGIRSALLSSGAFDVVPVVTSLGTAALIFVAGFLYFRSAERTFADII